MKIKIEFTEEEEYEAILAVHARRMQLAFVELNEQLRMTVKHNDDITTVEKAEYARSKLFEVLEDNNLKDIVLYNE